MKKKKTKAPDKIIFAAGSGLHKRFINYVASLTGKPDPKVCYIPTATGDHPNTIIDWYTKCEGLPIQPYILRTYIDSVTTQKSFEEILMDMDAIIVGGGNTLNMMAIWKAHGIDKLLKKAYNKGIIMAGGSAGSLCWFNAGSTDSRPKKLSIVEGLGILNFSHSPHYHKEAGRKPLYHQLIKSGELKSGYACDDLAGLLFTNGKFKRSVALDAENNNYFVSLKKGAVIEQLIPSDIIE
jgi:dipeptidase E